MIDQLNIYGMSRLEVSIERLRTFEPKEGYYLAFSGGKDSVVIKALADMAGVKYDAHYNVTSVDPPELVNFIREHHPDVAMEKPRFPDNYRNGKLRGRQITMWNLIPEKKMPPTRLVRYCCDKLKEHGGEGRFTITGVRWAESARRRNGRAGLEANFHKGKDRRMSLDPDNPDNEEWVRVCPTRGKHVLNPIIDWSDGEVWEFIRRYGIPYCRLYDEGYKRLGCVGCPMNSRAAEELERWPEFKRAYLRAFGKMLATRSEEGKETKWRTAEDVMEWWLGN